MQTRLTMLVSVSCVCFRAAIAGVCGEPGAGSCFQIHNTPGCNDAACCEIVCSQDSYCCTHQWDETCTIIAGVSCESPVSCPGEESCFLPHASTGCDHVVCCESVCALDASCCQDEWSDDCVVAALRTCERPTACTTDAVCHDPHETPGCSDGACCAIVCATLPNCCQIAWSGECVEAAWLSCAGGSCPSTGSCYAAHPNPGCENPDCCAAVCAQDEFCCTTTWDAMCAAMGAEICAGVGACPGEGDCWIPHETGGCTDQTCCTSLCLIDPHCCRIAWDAACVQLAEAMCDPPGSCPSSGGCLVAHDTPGCEDASCCNVVCEVDVYCCEQEWDDDCVNYAASACFGGGTCPGDGSCLKPHDSPGCDEANCCSVICASHPLCCASQWSEPCADLAHQLCGTTNCPQGAIITQSVPPDGTVDARQPHTVNLSLPRLGIGTADEPIRLTIGVDGAEECFELCETVVDAELGPNSIEDVTHLGGGEYRIVLARAITAGGATRIRLIGGAGVTYIAHPGNASGDTLAGPADILFVINTINGVQSPPHGLYSADIDRGGTIGPADILRVIDLLNGAGEFVVWSNTSRPSADGLCP